MSGSPAERAAADPLAPPDRDDAVLGRFLRHFGVEPSGAEGGAPDARHLAAVARAFACLPYENLTKIVKEAEAGRNERARRLPAEVIDDHIARGTGGTCFSLTATLLHLVRALGYQAEPLLADRRYGADTHCALLVRVAGAPCLLDPGFLVLEPLALAAAGEELRLPTPFHEILLRPRDGGARLELWTRGGGRETHRLTYKTAPADPGAFLRAWDASFGWEMMRYPVLARLAGAEQLYLQANMLQRRRQDGVERRELALDDLAGQIARRFGIDRRVAERALEILGRRGETRKLERRPRVIHGRAASS